MAFKAKKILVITIICILTVFVVSLVKVIWFAKEPGMPTETQVMPKVTTVQQPPIEDSVIGPKETSAEKRPVLNSKKMVIREKMRRAVENASKGNRRELGEITNTLEQHVSKELLPDYISYLGNDNAQVQLLGASALYHLKDKESKDAVYQYVQGKDFKQLEKMVYAQDMDERDYTQQMLASSLAIMTLGDIGDESVIPLLESLKGIKDLKLEFGYGTVHHALAMIGPEGIRILSKIRSGDDPRDKMRTESAIRHVKDPACIGALIEIVKNLECPENIRGAAISALSEMDNSKETIPFLISVMQSSEYSQYLREVAAKAIGTTDLPDARDALQKELENPDSTVSNACLLSLAANDPQKYLSEVMEWVMNTSLPMKDRKQLALGLFHMDAQVLAGHNEEIASGLTATDKDKHPADEVRVYIWKTLNKSTGQEVSLEVEDETLAYQELYGEIRQKTIRENVHASVAEVKEMVDTRIKSIIIKWQPEEGDL